MQPVLIIYTGGTIGMMNDPDTGVLYPFNFEKIAEEVPEIREFSFGVECIALPELIDSSNLSPKMWDTLCQIIYDNYNNYCGFVVLHGTDTMVYSAAALSFMIENLSKPIVFTGSQLPIGKIRTDGKANLVTAIEIAAAVEENRAIVPEVSILFGDKLFRGNRTSKLYVENFYAFQSFNYPALAQIGIHIHYNRSAIHYPENDAPIAIHKGCDERVAILKIFPGITPSVLQANLENPGIRAVILETFGAGNAPTGEAFLSPIRRAVERGMIILNVTQCLGGSVDMSIYETGTRLMAAGVIDGRDITTEAAVCKLMYLLSHETDTSLIKNKLNLDLKGEISHKFVGF